MLLQLDATQATVLEEILDAQRKELLVETARADAREFRDDLRHREEVVEALIAQLTAARRGHRRAG